MKVGFIGLGDLGAAIARRLARRGFEVIGCDIDPRALAAFDEPGADREPDPLAAAARAEVLCTCVRMDADLRRLVGDGDLFTALGEGGVFVIHSTVAPALCQDIARVALRRGVEVVDAGVSGGGHAALQGRLSIFAGGESAAVERVRPLLEACGVSVAHLGGVGCGMQGKLLNNLASTASYGLAAAVLDLGERLGLDRELLRGALMAGTADSYALQALPGLLRPEIAASMGELLGKDVAHARALVADGDPAMAPLAGAAQSLLERLARSARQTLSGSDGII